MQLRFDFQNKTRLFSHPIKIIQTDKINEVLSKLKQVEQAVNDGFYAAGYVAYEAAPAFHPYYQTQAQGEMPLLWFGIFNKPTTASADKNTSAHFPDCHWQASTTYQQYQSAIKHIRHQIAQGNTYQVNYTIRLDSPFHADSYSFYLYLLNAQRANYAAYLDIGRYQILSASPELFFHWQEQTITTKPMKGTIERGKTQEQDIIQRNTLHNSTKNQAENVMIIDLLRNDLSQIAQTGSVQVSSLFDVEKYPTVWQMTSTINAKTADKTTLTDVFKALFPCGSITGAPKASTMQLITELESSPREVYCGAIGFITPHKEALFSVPIRTVIVDSQTHSMRYGVGGGITWDSTDKEEYQETIDKAQILYGVKLPQQLLESILLNDGQYTLLERHLNRLEKSANYFDFSYSSHAIEQQLAALKIRHPQGEWKIRLLLSPNGNISLEAEPLSSATAILSAQWSPFAVNSKNRLLYHKTTQRSHYPTVTLNNEYLLFNEQEQITEFVNGNVALLINGEWLTPAISCGLLPGTMREQLIAAGTLKEAILYKNQLASVSKIAFINSVRGWRDVVWKNSTN